MCIHCASASMLLLAHGLAAAATVPDVTPDQRALLTNVEHAVRSFHHHTTSPDTTDDSAERLITDLSVLNSTELRDVGVTLHFMAFSTRSLSESILAILHQRAEKGDETAAAIVARDTRDAEQAVAVEVHVIDMDQVRRDHLARNPMGVGRKPPMMS
jgi:hypothetical protein